MAAPVGVVSSTGGSPGRGAASGSCARAAISSTAGAGTGRRPWGGADAARAERQRAAGEALDAEQAQADDGATDVDDRVDGADLVEMGLRGRPGAVDRGLGRAEQPEDAGRAGAVGGRQAGALDEVKDLAQGARRRVALAVDGDGGGGEAGALRGRGGDAPAGEAQRLERGGEVGRGDAGGDDGAEQHVAGDAGDGVEVGRADRGLVECAGRGRWVAHGRLRRGEVSGASVRRLTSAAWQPAPKPLSMLTTVTPGAKALRVASSAARPSKAAP